MLFDDIDVVQWTDGFPLVIGVTIFFSSSVFHHCTYND
jgi:hypothetical protein